MVYDNINEAIINGDFSAVEEFVAKDKENVNFKPHGFPLLYYAIGSQEYNIAKFLLNNGAETGFVDSYYQSPYYIAVLLQNYERITFLLNNGIDLETKDKYGDTPLLTAVKRKDVTMMKFLIENGAKTTSVDRYFDSPLYLPLFMEDYEKLKVLLNDDSANIEHRGLDTPLIIAMQDKSFTMMKFLIQNRADINFVNSVGMTPLTTAINMMDYEVINFLIENGADINLQDHDVFTPLLAAFFRSLKGASDECRDENYEMIKFLIAQGANINLNHHIEETPEFQGIDKPNIITIAKLMADCPTAINSAKFLFSQRNTNVFFQKIEGIEDQKAEWKSHFVSDINESDEFETFDLVM